MAQTLPSVAAGDTGLSRYMEEIRRFPMLEPQEEYMLAKRYHEHEDTEAAHKLAEAPSPEGVERLVAAGVFEGALAP